MNDAFTVVIPARPPPSGLPGKPLQDIAGKPMIQHVWEQAGKSSARQVVVATDDARIVEVCRGFGAEVLLTRADHNSGTDGLALTFSRAPLPWARDAFAVSREQLPANVPYRRHIGIYAYRAQFLHDFVAWGPCWLEDTECLEQLRALWHGVRIHVADALQAPPAGVDTREDLERVRRLLGA